MMVPFNPEGGLLLSLARALAASGDLCVFGVSAFAVLVLPRALHRAEPAVADRLRAGIARLLRCSALAALLGAGGWLVAQSAALAGAASPAAALQAIPAVLARTEFGHVLAMQAALLLAILPASTRPRLALALGAAALTLQAGHSHAISMEPGLSLLLVSDVVHLWAAGAWLGGLPPLLLVVHAAPPKVGASAARWFSPLGKACVVAMVVTAGVQGWGLIASLPGLVGTAYGWMALGKLVLFGALFAFALANRYRLAPALLRSDPDRARRALVTSIAAQSGVGLAVVAAAAVLSNLPPSLHEQPVWPFPVQPSLVTVGEDPEFKRIVVVALVELAAAALLLTASLALRRWRPMAIALMAVAAWWAVPDLRLLVVPATPTSFYRSPTNFSVAAIVRGAALYPVHCAACHGVDGHGDGRLAGSLPVPPADLTAAHLWAHTDGEMFGWLADGIEAPDGSRAMPGFGGTLSTDDRWALIDYVRANNAGIARRESGAWPVPLAAPELAAACPNGRRLTLADLRGRAVRLVFEGSVPATPLSDTAATTITVGATGPGCATADPAVIQAYATVLGVDPAGSDVLIDPNGWLRSAAPGRLSPALLAALVQEICTNPLAGGSESHHHHGD